MVSSVIPNRFQRNPDSESMYAKYMDTETRFFQKLFSMTNPKSTVFSDIAKQKRRINSKNELASSLNSESAFYTSFFTAAI